MIIVKTTLSLALLLLCLPTTVNAQDITQLEKIGAIVSFVKSEKAVLFTCADKSQVQITLLAPDLVRIRASFTKPFPPSDHS